jgi:alkanesulfonate monooxygenase SsuD/methylene tetrahydromethanopterin reductase-like flavin-dependent oxidoreductase (luciferase family)
MRAGVSLNALNTEDWDRVLARDWSRGPTIPDHLLLDEAKELGDLVEPLGFDTIWTPEHFATPYSMVPNVLQYLAYWAGRTERIDMGSIVIVLPWHHPIDVAHQIAMLDILLEGRHYTVGVGRGVSPREYLPLGIDQGTARERFNESIDIIRLALTQQSFSYEGEIFQVPEMSLRPQPRHWDLCDDIIVASVSPDSIENGARQGLGLLCAQFATFAEVEERVATFNRFRHQYGFEPAEPTFLLVCYCVETENEVEEGQRYLQQVGVDGFRHYFPDPAQFANIKGYEHYAEMFKKMEQSGGSNPAFSNSEGTIVGTPDQLIEKLSKLQATTNAREVAFSFRSSSTMPHEKSLKSMKLFAKEVLPAVHELPGGKPRTASAV